MASAVGGFNNIVGLLGDILGAIATVLIIPISSRAGVTSSGHKLNPELMPWDVFGRMTDDEFKAIWLYLRSLPALEQYTP